MALWEEGLRNSLCLFTATPCYGPTSSILLAVCVSLPSLWEDSSELLPVTPLAFPDLALVLLGLGIALLLGGSGVDVLI